MTTEVLITVMAVSVAAAAVGLIVYDYIAFWRDCLFRSRVFVPGVTVETWYEESAVFGVNRLDRRFTVVGARDFEVMYSMEGEGMKGVGFTDIWDIGYGDKYVTVYQQDGSCTTYEVVLRGLFRNQCLKKI